MAGDPNHGRLLNEGKTKAVYEFPGDESLVAMKSKSVMTADDGGRIDWVENKATLSNYTNDNVFRLLNYAGVRTAYIRWHSADAFIARRCAMIPIEWIVRRQAYGPFLTRNPRMKEGDVCSPPAIESHFKDDTNHDPVWSEAQVIAAKFKIGSKVIGRDEVEIMKRMTVTTFEILERAWASLNCSLIDIKVEFGVTSAGDILLADVIENDSWRLWEDGDPNKMRDWQIYDTMFINNELTANNLEVVRKNCAWVAQKSKGLMSEPRGRVAVITDRASSIGHWEKVRDACLELGVTCDLKVTSDHGGTGETRKILAEYEGASIPTVVIALVICRNTLDVLLKDNVCFPVVNYQPNTADREAEDLRSGLPCPTVFSPEAAALHSARILGLVDHMIWARIHARHLNHWIFMKQA